MKHFTILELGADSESPMIGSILNIQNTEDGQKSFGRRLLVALQDHFDVTDIGIPDIPDLFAGSPYEDIVVVLNPPNSHYLDESEEYHIRILETWIY